MKKLLIILCAVILFHGIPGIANAALIDQADGTILDNTNNLLWQQDLTEFTNMNYWQQRDYITATFGSEWHMATGTEIALFSGSYDFADIDNVFVPTYTEGLRVEYLGRFNVFNTDGTVSVLQFILDGDGIHTYEGTTTLYKKELGYTHLGAWVAKVVPIPGAVWLLGSGIIGIVGIRRKFRK